MAPSELLRQFVTVLERLDLRYLITGSMATIAYGEPRFTNDNASRRSVPRSPKRSTIASRRRWQGRSRSTLSSTSFTLSPA